MAPKVKAPVANSGPGAAAAKASALSTDATTTVSVTEYQQLQTEVKKLRAENEKLKARLETMHAQPVKTTNNAGEKAVDDQKPAPVWQEILNKLNSKSPAQLRKGVSIQFDKITVEELENLLNILPAYEFNVELSPTIINELLVTKDTDESLTKHLRDALIEQNTSEITAIINKLNNRGALRKFIMNNIHLISTPMDIINKTPDYGLVFLEHLQKQNEPLLQDNEFLQELLLRASQQACKDIIFWILESYPQCTNPFVLEKSILLLRVERLRKNITSIHLYLRLRDGDITSIVLSLTHRNITSEAKDHLSTMTARLAAPNTTTAYTSTGGSAGQKAVASISPAAVPSAGVAAAGKSAAAPASSTPVKTMHP